jgi:hypothetical protein
MQTFDRRRPETVRTRQQRRRRRGGRGGGRLTTQQGRTGRGGAGGTEAISAERRLIPDVFSCSPMQRTVGAEGGAE